MSVSIETKKHICIHLNDMLDEKATMLEKAVESAKESRNNDTKSSAGDKYETGRAMMQMEIDKNLAQIQSIITQKKDLACISLTHSSEKVEYGSLVQTNLGTYFFSVALGKIIVNSKEYYAISIASPVGQALKDKKVGEKVRFQGREIIVQQLS